jgi:hypothetical protein
MRSAKTIVTTFRASGAAAFSAGPAASEAPQPRQNLAFAPIGLPHDGQRRSSGVPHSSQKAEPGGFS